MTIGAIEILQFVSIVYQQTELFIQSNQDLTLQMIVRLYYSVADGVTCLSGRFVVRQSSLITNSVSCQGFKNTYATISLKLGMAAILLLDEDSDFVKLTLSSFSYVRDYQTFLRIQDTYADTIWKYLLYRYIHFRKLLCILLMLFNVVLLHLFLKIHL